jgi:hypothetical protein
MNFSKKSGMFETSEGWEQWHRTNEQLIAREKQLQDGWTSGVETSDWYMKATAGRMDSVA